MLSFAMMVSSLPPEIWSTIVDYLPFSDRLQVSKVSPQLCAVARRIIYRNLELRSDKHAAQATLALLTRDHSVARNIKQLRIYTAEKAAKGAAWFNADALAGMANLWGLDLTRMPFHTTEDQVKFNNAISKSLPALRKLEYGTPYPTKRKPRRQGPGTNILDLQISGLQEITWIDPDAFVHPSPILPLVNASRVTLTDIRLPAPISYTVTYDPLTQFFALRFPHLSTLHLGGCNTSPPVDAALTNFIIAHPLIEVLHLGLSGPSKNRKSCHVSPVIALDRGTLPRLRTLKVDAFNLGMFALSRMYSLRTLESLHTGIDSHDEERGARFTEMYEALEECGGLPRLGTLKLELYGLEDDLENARWIAGLGRLCPKVEQFWGDLGVGWAAITRQDIFASYGNLKLQVMPDNGLDELRKRDRINGVREFAVHNSSVTDLQFYYPDDVDIIKFRFVIERDEAGKIVSMDEVLKGRPLRVAGFADFASGIRYAKNSIRTHTTDA